MSPALFSRTFWPLFPRRAGLLAEVPLTTLPRLVTMVRACARRVDRNLSSYLAENRSPVGKKRKRSEDADDDNDGEEASNPAADQPTTTSTDDAAATQANSVSPGKTKAAGLAPEQIARMEVCRSARGLLEWLGWFSRGLVAQWRILLIDRFPVLPGRLSTTLIGKQGPRDGAASKETGVFPPPLFSCCVLVVGLSVQRIGLLILFFGSLPNHGRTAGDPAEPDPAPGGLGAVWMEHQAEAGVQGRQPRVDAAGRLRD